MSIPTNKNTFGDFGDVVNELLEMFPQREDNLVIKIGKSLVFAGSSKGDSYFSIVSLIGENNYYKIERHDLDQADRDDLQKSLYMFLYGLNFNFETIEKTTIKIGKFSLSIRIEKKEGDREGIFERVTVINHGDVELIKIDISENGINDLLSALLFLRNGSALWNRNNIAVLSDSTTYIFTYKFMGKGINVISYGNSMFDMGYHNLSVGIAYEVLNGAYTLEIPNDESKTSSHQITFGGLGSIAIQIFLRRGRPSLS